MAFLCYYENNLAMLSGYRYKNTSLKRVLSVCGIQGGKMRSRLALAGRTMAHGDEPGNGEKAHQYC